MNRQEFYKIVDKYLNRQGFHVNTTKSYATALREFYTMCRGEVFNIDSVDSYLKQLLSSKLKIATVENKYHAIKGFWVYYNDNCKPITKLDINAIDDIKRKLLDMARGRNLSNTQPTLIPQPTAQPALAEYTPTECYNSDIIIIRAKLKQVKISTNEIIVAKQQKLIDDELVRRSYNSLSEWLIDRGDVLLAILEQR